MILPTETRKELYSSLKQNEASTLKAIYTAAKGIEGERRLEIQKRVEHLLNLQEVTAYPTLPGLLQYEGEILFSGLIYLYQRVDRLLSQPEALDLLSTDSELYDVKDLEQINFDFFTAQIMYFRYYSDIKFLLPESYKKGPAGIKPLQDIVNDLGIDIRWYILRLLKSKCDDFHTAKGIFIFDFVDDVEGDHKTILRVYKNKHSLYFHSEIKDLDY
jgi:hypothetical protein